MNFTKEFDIYSPRYLQYYLAQLFLKKKNHLLLAVTHEPKFC